MIRESFILPILFCLLGLTYSDLRNGNCQKLGTLCSDDNRKVLLCTEINKPSIDIGDCDEKDQCKMVNETAQCVDMTKVTLQFECSEKGEFPDPGNCEQTYICNSDRGKPSEVCKCPEGSYVHPEEGLHCVEPECPREPIICEEGATNHFELTNGAKTSFLYYCKSADSVTVFKNVDVKNFKLNKGVDLGKIRNGKKCVPFTNDKPSPNPSKCEKFGDVSPAECDCDFYYCDKNLKLVRTSCHETMRFDVKKKTCIIGMCNESECTGR